ncbi:E3 ubiquitin-protein ligase RNF8-like [Gigantopelta aegis]|uniref:E3 ubiquitin-protein ligase RNF8-like n=1 Tax=Gigantopelta aegis TaxID=1735272 RepID=UPI001B888892|nr:E3 ubiquitin-protein ligase RNF8-like [Gigantopelta aegis]
MLYLTIQNPIVFPMAYEHLPCLQRIGDNVKKYRLLLLETDKVTIGRSPEVTHCLLSVMISRCHCILNKNPDSSWTITDNKSLNGVFVNGEKLVAQEPHKLSEGDTIQLGISTSPSKAPEFLYKFFSSVKIKRQRPKSSSDSEPKSKRLKSSRTTEDENKTKSTQPESDSHVSSSQPDLEDGKDVTKRLCGDQVDGRSPYKKYKEQLRDNEERQAEEMRRIQERMLEMQNQLKEKEEEQARMQEELSKEKQEREAQAVTLSELKKQEEKLKQEMLQKQEALLKEKVETERLIREELETQLKSREDELMDHLKVQREALLSEKQRVEERLQNEMAKALEEKDKLLETELLQQKEQLDKVLEKKELEQKVLESQLLDTKAESEKQKESVLQAREDVLSNFAELMETELQCSICNELFVQATSLNCSHAFCALCIANWMKRKKECPICRAPVTSHMRSIVLDSYIDAMSEHLSDEMKEKRKELVQARKEEQAKFDEENRVQEPGPSGGRGRGRGRVRGQARVRGAARGGPGGSRHSERLIVVESDDSELLTDDSENDNSDSGSVSGESDSYYGGYGRCYTCGALGHWANGCPLN